MTEDSLILSAAAANLKRYAVASIVVPCFLILSGCTDNPSVVKYQAPKAPAEPIASSMTMPANSDLPPAGMDTTGIEWTVPSSWEEGKASSMRMASFAIPLDDGSSGDVSLVELAGPAGGMLANVNRWRGQVGLADLTVQGLNDALVERTTASGMKYLAVEMVNEASGSAIVAGIFEKGGSTLFAKLAVTESGMEQATESFYAFCDSISFGEAPQAVAAPAAPSMPAMDPSLVPPADMDRSDIGWSVPNGWAEGKASSMRLASYALSHSDGSMGDLSVVKLAGPAGGLLANVNRWRGQVGLDPLTSGELTHDLADRKTAEGVDYFTVEMVNKATGAAIHAGIYELEDATLFVKLNTNQLGLVESRQSFYEYCDSLSFAK